MVWTEVYLRTKWHLDPSSRLAQQTWAEIGRGAVPLGGWSWVPNSPSNTMWPEPRPTSVPSFILIHLTYTNVTDRTDRQDDGPHRANRFTNGRPKTTRPNFTKFYVHVTSGRAWLAPSLHICYVLPVLWMTLCYHIMSQIQIQAWNLRRTELFTVKAKFHYASWFRASSEPVRSRFGAGSIQTA